MAGRGANMIVEKYPFQIFFELVKIRDADTPVGTIWVEGTTSIPVLGLEFSGRAPLKVAVRLEGVAAPENHTPEGLAATEWAKAWFKDREGMAFYLHTAGKLDAFGRWLGDIRTSSRHLVGLANDLLLSPHGEPYKRELHGAW